MTAGRTVAVVAISGAAVIALADAPQWELEPFAAWLAVMTGTAFIAQMDNQIGKTLAVFLMAVVLVRKGKPAVEKLQGGLAR